jgi:hypothetical protein
MADSVFRDDVQCFVRSLEYDFRSKSGVLRLEDASCTDMSGCINLFKKIDPGVVRIMTIAEGRRDTGYVLVDGKWEARVSPEVRRG